MILTGKQVKYRGTVTGLKISAVDGTAFIDAANSSITDLADGNHQIEIFDSAGRFLKGFLKLVGSSETLGDDLLAGFDFTSVWGKVNATVTGVNSFNTTGGYLQISDANAVLLGLFKGTLACTSDSGTVTQRYGTLTYLSSGDSNKYYTNAGSAQWIIGNNYNPSTNTVNTWTNYQVTAPSSSGATIVSTKGGTTYNFAYKNTSFTYNAASYYCIVSKVR